MMKLRGKMEAITAVKDDIANDRRIHFRIQKHTFPFDM